jgi:hypothetical protein
MIKSFLPTSLLFFVLLFLFSSCSPSKKDKPEQAEANKNVSSYPALRNEEITRLYSIAEKVDIIFYNLPMSVNQDDAASAKNTVLYIAPAPAIITHSCKPLGRLSWLSQGVIVREADIFSDTGCQYLLFMVDNKPVAANALSESGIQFFQQILTQVQQQQK